MKTKYIFLIMAVVLLLVGCGIKPENMELSETMGGESITGRSVVQIQTGSSFGSGVIYAENDTEVIVVTAKHIVEGNPETAEVLWPNQEAVSASEVTCSETSDVAFVTVAKELLPEDVTYQCAQTDKEAYDSLAEGAGLVMVGRTSRDVTEVKGELLYPWIYAEDFAQYMMIVEGAVDSGMSGGGVYDVNGNLTGIICGVNEEGRTAAVPLAVLRAEYVQYCE